MELRIVWQSLFHHKLRAIAAIAGISFTIILVFVQVGLYEAILRTATLIEGRLDYDIALVSPHYVFMGNTSNFPRRRMVQARAVSGVQGAVPIYVGIMPWRNEVTGKRWQMFILAFRPDDHVFHHPEIESQQAALKQPDTVLLDRDTRLDFGPLEPGVVTELGSHKVKVVGHYTLGFGFLGFGALVTTDQSYARLYDGYPLQDVSMGLVKLAPGANLVESVKVLRQTLGHDVRVLSRSELKASETRYWATQSSVGLIAGFGAGVAVIVGIVVLYQVLVTDISNNLPQFAMLKAIGYTNAALGRIVLLKVLLLGVLAYVPAVPAALVVYAITRAQAKLPIEMNLGELGGVFLLTLMMSVITGFLCMRKLRTADPADLY